MPAHKRKSVLDRLPTELAFLKPCVREMRKLRAGFRPSLDPKEHPEAARDEEIDRFLKRDLDILGRHLRKAVPSDSQDEFCQRVRGLVGALMRWLKPHDKRVADDAEVATLYVIVGFLMNPWPYNKPPAKKPARKRKVISRRSVADSK